ncbi:PAS domain S-box protein [Sandaracinus amylolyticus]|nr:PAS domain S-box protein [Sandaracinus amylolyticus]
MSDHEKTREALIDELASLRQRLVAAEQQLAATRPTELERQRVQRELQRQEERLRLIVDGVRDHAISVLDAEGRIVTFNAAAAQIKGYQLAEVQGQHFRVFFTEEDRASGLPELELETARAHGRYEGEGWRLRKDGSRFYAAVSLSALHDPSGEIVGFVKVTQDRTRYRELTDALQERETRLQLILDGVRDHAISMLDPEGRVVTFNAPAERIKGYRLDEVQGKYFGMFFTPEDRASGLPETELEVARAQGRYQGEGWRQRKDGSRFYAAVSLSALHASSGALVGFVKVTQDRTRFRELTETLQRREAELRLIVDAIPGLVAYLSRDQTYQQVNRAYEAWFGRPSDELLGKHLVDVLGPAAYAAVRPHVEAALAGEPRSFVSELPYEHAGTRWVRASYVPDRGPDGTVQGFVSLVLDVTDAKRAEQQLAEEARLNETLYRVSTALAADLDLDSIFARLTDEATKVCRAQFGAFFHNVTSPDGGSYMLYTLSGVSRDRFAGFPMPRNTALFAPTFAGAGVVRSSDVTKDARYGQEPPYHGMPTGHLPVRSYLAVPVVSRSGEVHGGLFFGHAEPGVFTEKDERMLVAVAAHAAVAIDNARLHAATMTAEQQYRALAESSPQLVWTTSPDGAVEYCNPQFLAYVGLSLEQMRSEPTWQRIVHPDDVAAASAAWTRALTTGEPYEVEYRLKRAADGSYRWFLARGAPVRDGDGRIIRWVGSCTDIDDRKRSEETQRFLAEAGALLTTSLDYRATLPTLARLAVPHMADWCAIELVTDAGGLERVALAHVDPNRIELLRELDRQFPSVEHEAALRVARTGVPDRAREITDEMLVASARGPEHLALLRELGLRSWMAVPIAAHRRVVGVISFASSESGRLFEERDLDVAEELGRRVGVTIDNARLFEMTQRERLRAEEASRAKDELLSVTSHELRTPLNAILGWSRMLRSGTLNEEKRDRALETIERNARVQVQLVDDLLDFSRVMTGRLRLSLAPVEPAAVVEAAVDVVRPAADAKNVRLQVLLDPDAGTLNGDSARLQQVVWNLLSNAVKFTPKGGRIYVRVERESSHVQIVVSDTGAGIEPSFIPHVFQPFRQQDSTITRAHGGLGLGLAIVKHLVELHGGTIGVASEGIGKGATFVVQLPVSPLRSTSLVGSETRKAVSRPEAPLRCPPELDGIRILVCEDEPDARDLIESILEECRATVVLAASVDEALDRFREAPPDVLISDIGMPDASGYELIRQVRALPPERGGRVPAIALTAYASMNDRTRALMEGFQNHVAKPTEPQELVAAIAALVGRRMRG